MKRKKQIFFCYTDGSCKKGEDQPGGWGVFVTGFDVPLERWGFELKTSSLRMELMAVAQALGCLPEESMAVVFSDSKITLEYCEKWIPIWKKHEWKTSQIEKTHEISKNIDVFKVIDHQIVAKKLFIQWRWIRGHHGNTGNERADYLARLGAREAKSQLTNSK